jgi:hypothetical protein
MMTKVIMQWDKPDHEAVDLYGFETMAEASAFLQGVDEAVAGTVVARTCHAFVSDELPLPYLEIDVAFMRKEQFNEAVAMVEDWDARRDNGDEMDKHGLWKGQWVTVWRPTKQYINVR